MRLAHSAYLRSRLRHVSSAPSMCNKSHFPAQNIVQDVAVATFSETKVSRTIYFLLENARKTVFLNNPTIIQYFLPISHFPKQFEIT